ncbi:MAG TPA: DUF2934 domain-containing protein [Candidatus Binataceae bacterium]|nr:DUF2934 domain-containing protein [Candidatus Binataceae bacterium]
MGLLKLKGAVPLTPPKEKEPKKPKAPRKSTVKAASKKSKVILEPIGETTAPANEPSRSIPIQIAGADNSRANAPSSETIRVRAYELYLARGGTDGRDLEDWLAAERELMAKA